MVNAAPCPTPTHDFLSAEREGFAEWFREALHEGLLLKRALRTFYFKIAMCGAHKGKKDDTQELVNNHFHRRITTVMFMERLAALFERAPASNAVVAKIDTYVKTLYEKNEEVKQLGALINSIDGVLDAQRA